MGNLIRSNIAVFVLIAIVSGAVYFNSLDNGFHFDDRHHILNNRYIRSVKNIPLFFVDLNTFSSIEKSEHYRPLILISHAINYFFGRLSPVGYHLVNIALHVGTAFLLFLIVKAMLCKEVALAVALIFVVHPFNSEAINYITARSSVMCAFFYLLSFYCWIRFREDYLLPTTYFYIASLLAFLLAMVSKEIAITLPIMLWLYDLYFISQSSGDLKGGQNRQSFAEYIKQFALYIPYILFIAVPYLLLRSYLIGNVVSSGELPRGYYSNLLLETKVLVKYLYLLFFPVKLSVEHAVLEVTSTWDWTVFGSVILLLAVIGLSIFLYKTRDTEWRIVSFFIFWFFITMIPTTIVPLNAPLQENRGYLAGAGFAIFLGVAVNRFAQGNNYGGILKKSALILILLLYSIMTIERNTQWKDDLTLWLDAVEKSPQAWRAHDNLAAYYETIGLESLAIGEYKKAIEIKKDNYESINYLGGIYLKKGNLDLALAELKKSVSIKPAYIEAHMNLARTYVKLGQMDMAKKEYETVVELGEIFNKKNETVAEARKYLRWFK